MKDLAHNITATLAMAAEDLSATQNGTAIDTKGYESLTFVINVGTNTGNAFSATDKLTFTVEKDDNSGFSSGTAIAAADYIVAKRSSNAAWDRVLDEAADDDQVYTIGVRLQDPDNRYYRLVCTEAGTVTTVDVYAEAILGHPIERPTS